MSSEFGSRQLISCTMRIIVKSYLNVVVTYGNVCEEALKRAAMCLESSLGQCDA